MNIGIILPNLEYNQLAYEVIYNINNEIATGSKHDYRIFFEDIGPRVIQPSCAVMNISEIWHFDGVLISTTLKNTVLATKVVSNITNIFYAWDLEWLRGQNNFIYNLSVYRNKQLLLLTRSKEYADAIYNYSNRRVDGIMPEPLFGELVNELTNRKNN